MISSIFCTSSPVVASTMGSSSSTPREYSEPPSLNSIGMAFLLCLQGSREVDLLQAAILSTWGNIVPVLANKGQDGLLLSSHLGQHRAGDHESCADRFG